MADVFDLLIPSPSQFGRIGWRSEPPCNGGSAKKPPKPEPAPAHVRADSAAAGEQAAVSASRRAGLRSTITPSNPLAPNSSLGSIGLGMGGEGAMVNTYVPPVTKPRTVMGRLQQKIG